MNDNSELLNQLSMLKKVTEDIYLLSIPIPFGMVQVNCYLLRGTKGFTVIDTGMYSTEGIEIWEKLLELGIKIEKVVLTHYHIDHLGLARWFQEKHRVPVFISSIGYREVKRRQDKDHAEYVMNLFKKHGSQDLPSLGSKYDSYIYNFEPDGTFENGEQIRLGNEMYEAIWTPGHSADHFCFYNQNQQIMIVGDLVLDRISPVILIESQNDSNPLKDYFTSLDKMGEYPITIALPGHGKIIENLDKRMEEIKSGHRYRCGEMLEVIKDEGKAALTVSQEIYGRGKALKSSSQLMATITRFIYLESIGKVKSELINGTVYYSLVE